MNVVLLAQAGIKLWDMLYQLIQPLAFVALFWLYVFMVRLHPRREPRIDGPMTLRPGVTQCFYILGAFLFGTIAIRMAYSLPVPKNFNEPAFSITLFLGVNTLCIGFFLCWMFSASRVLVDDQKLVARGLFGMEEICWDEIATVRTENFGQGFTFIDHQGAKLTVPVDYVGSFDFAHRLLQRYSVEFLQPAQASFRRLGVALPEA